MFSQYKSWLHPLLILLCTLNLMDTRRISFNISIVEYEYDEMNNEYENAEFDPSEHVKQHACLTSQDLFVPNRNDCSQYFVCGTNEEAPIMGMCLHGMWFDPHHSDSEALCVFPEIICATDHTDAYQYCNCTEHYPKTAKQPGEIINAFDDPLIETSPLCIVDNKLHTYGSERDCERYFICYNEMVFRMQCKPGMHYNADHGFCDLPEKAECEILNQECPPTGITFLRHPTKCDAFYYCYYGQRMLQSCDFYYIWDEEEQMCVRKDQGRCHLDDE